MASKLIKRTLNNVFARRHVESIRYLEEVVYTEMKMQKGPGAENSMLFGDWSSKVFPNDLNQFQSLFNTLTGKILKIESIEISKKNKIYSVTVNTTETTFGHELKVREDGRIDHNPFWITLGAD